MKKILLFIFSLIVIPMTALAAGDSLREITNVNGLILKLTGLGNAIIYLLISAAVVYIVYYVVRNIVAGSPEEKAKNSANVGWGILGLFIILSLWGIVNVLINTFYTDPNISDDRFPNANFISNGQSQSSGQTNTTIGGGNTQNYFH